MFHSFEEGRYSTSHLFEFQLPSIHVRFNRYSLNFFLLDREDRDKTRLSKRQVTRKKYYNRKKETNDFIFVLLKSK